MRQLQAERGARRRLARRTGGRRAAAREERRPVPSAAVRVLYTPFKILAGLLARRAGQAALTDIWATFADGTPPPPAHTSRRPLGAVFFTAAVQAAILAGVGAVIDQLAARSFHHLFGAWPGKAPATADPVDPAAG